MKKNKNTVKIFDAWGDDTGVRIIFTRFRWLSSYWREVRKEGRYDVTTLRRIEDDGEGRFVLVSEGHAGPGFTEDGCSQNDCPNCGIKCQTCSCRSEGWDEYTILPRGACLAATPRGAFYLQ